MSRRNVILVRLAAIFALMSCGDLEDELELEPCTVPEDCWHTQECTQTLQEKALALPGVCMEEGHGCFPGAQLGCTCNPNDPSINCQTTPLPAALQQVYPKMECDPAMLVCVPKGGN